MTEVIVWSGWIGGLAVGLYALFQWLVSGHALGVSTGFRQPVFVLLAQRIFSPGRIRHDQQLAAVVSHRPALGRFFGGPHVAGRDRCEFLAGTNVRQCAAACAVGERPGADAGRRLIGYGARSAGGCTSGHSIAGLAMLNPPSVLASAGFFAGGILAVQVMFRLLA